MDALGILSVDRMRRPVAPEDVLEMLLYKYTRRCTIPDCMCMKNRLKRTYTCIFNLQTCVNMAAVDDIPEEMSDGDEEERQ